MKKVLLYIAIVLLFISVLATIKGNTVNVISIDYLIDVMSRCPRLDLSYIIETYIEITNEGIFVQIPIFGFLFEVLGNIGIVLVTLIEFLFNIITICLYFTGEVLLLN